MSFKVSTAKAKITPTLASNPYMGGYGVQAGLRVASSSTPYREPLYARCVVIWDDGNPNAIISLDVLALPRSMHQALVPRLFALASWAKSDFVIQVTHTHNGPALVDELDPFIAYNLSDLTLIRSYSSWLEDQIVAVVKSALSAARTSVTLDYSVTSMNFAYNRAGLPYAETAVPVITARKSNGQPRAIIFSYGCHPVSAGYQNLFDGDWPAGACSAIEGSGTNIFALFLQGPAGDQDPAGSRDWPLRDALADQMATAVIATAGSPGRTLTSPIYTSYQEVQLPLDIITTPANLAAVRASYVTRMANPEGQPSWYQRHAQLAINKIDNGDTVTSVSNPSQVWKFGGSPGLSLALTGGELVSGYAVYFRGQFGGPANLIIGGYANEVCFYVPANNFLPPLGPAFGSYEGGWDPDFPGIAGGNLTVYPQIAHFRAGSAGVEAATINALTAQLS
ncbi:MAG: hypothetical protein ABI255_04270 [Microbacteriaceae bacterium]